MYKNILQSIDGIGIYPIISLVIFVFFFISLFYMVVKMKKTSVKAFKNIPLETEENDSPTQTLSQQ